MPFWEPETIREILNHEGMKFQEKEIDYGVQFRLQAGSVVNVYESGKIIVAGRKGAERGRLEALFSAGIGEEEGGLGPSQIGAGKVFIVYGHDLEARHQLELILHKLKLEPIVLQNLPSGGDTIIEKLEHHSEVKYACVLLTPDDEGHRKDHPEEEKCRARQNVVLEMGMFLAKLGRKKVAVLHKGDLELPSDIQGLNYIPFKDRVDEIRDKLAAELQEAGFTINIKDILS